MNNFPEDLLYTVSEFLDLGDLKEFNLVSKNCKTSIRFSQTMIKRRILEGKYSFIPPCIAYKIGSIFLTEKRINNFNKLIPYFNKPISISIFCNLKLDEAKSIICVLKKHPQLIEYKELVDDEIINIIPHYFYSKFISNYIYYLIAKWTFGVNTELFKYSVINGCEVGYSNLFNKNNFYPLDGDEQEDYNLMLSITREYDI